jgi:DMSO/TMAO reductase YedYZ heme-binding membrane subunit
VKKRKFLLAHRQGGRVVVLLLGMGAVAAPFVIVAVSGVQMDVLTYTMRLGGLLAFTLIFMNLVTGPMSRWFYQLFKPRRVYWFHVSTGVVGFTLGVLHGTIVFALAHYRDHPAVWLIGPIALGLMAVTMLAAMNRRRLPQLWRRIHQLNYLIFVAIYIKAMWIGSNVTAPTAAGNAMKALLSLELLVVAVATYMRVRTRVRVPAKRPAETVVEESSD